MRTSLLVSASLLACTHSVAAFPRASIGDFKRATDQVQTTEIRDGQTGTLIVIPDPQTDLGTKQIPDAAHPFKAPGPGDMRGPCPALNTMANHGYIPRNGIASFEQIVHGAMEAFNQDRDLVAFQAAYSMLARGNAFIDLVSIGGPSPLIPPLPGKIDGPVALGLATHGRFEGDLSSTRQDVAIGDNRDFQDVLYDEFLLYAGLYGDDSPLHGNHTIINLKVWEEFKWARFLEDQPINPTLTFHAGREFFSYGEPAFALAFFSNGTEGTLSVPGMGSFFRNQTFPPNFWRRSTPGVFKDISGNAASILAAHFVPPGANDAHGNYIADPGVTIETFLCDAYADLVGANLAHTLMNTTGLLRQNVNTLVNALFVAFSNGAGCTTLVTPNGPAGV